jgi:protein TonB
LIAQRKSILKRYIIISIIFHTLIIVIALLLISNKRHEERKPFVARIVTPDELSNEAKKKNTAILREDKTIKRDHDREIHSSERETPKVLSAVPSSPSAKKAPLEPPALARELPSKDGGIKSLPHIGGAKAYRDESGTQPSEKTLQPGVQQAPIRDRLFDRDVIAKVSKQDQKGVKNGSSITFDTEEFKYYGYMQRLKEKIESAWKYPPDAAARREYGDLYIQFTISKNGKIGAVEVFKTSGHPSLDTAAIKALRDADPYWPLPDAMGKDSLTITGHFVYVDGAYFVR